MGNNSPNEALIWTTIWTKHNLDCNKDQIMVQIVVQIVNGPNVIQFGPFYKNEINLDQVTKNDYFHIQLFHQCHILHLLKLRYNLAYK